MRPAQMLLGLTVNDHWKVLEFASRPKDATGGKFSTGYIVENIDGRRGFLKAMDYVQALQHPDAPKMLEIMTTSYNFEKRVCEKCRDNYMKRVVHAIETGYIQADPAQPFSRVEYLIFDLADGDIRAHLDAQQRFDVAFALRTLHHITVGLQQLHKVGIAHQDLKPSNVLVFPRDEGSKISDFGRAWSRDFRAPHDDYQIPGDMSYAPPELLYGEVATDVNRRRYGCDVYHLGSMAVFFFTRVHMNALLVKHLAPEHRPFTWNGPYSAVLPYVQAAYAQALAEFIDSVPDYLQNDFAEAIGQLCEPDPARRGHPLNQQGHVNQFGLDRYVSKFNLLSSRAELRMIGGAK